MEKLNQNELAFNNLMLEKDELKETLSKIVEEN